MAGLTNKQRVFIEHYLATWNATEAARQAGYKHPNVEGPQNLVKPSIAEVIKQRIAEKTMTADEVLVRLSEQARADMRDVFTVDQNGENAQLDLARLLTSGKSHLVKSISFTKYGPRIELHDAQAALVHIGKHHGLFKDMVDHSGEVVVKVLRDVSMDDL